MLSMREYFASATRGEIFVPEAPGVYLWTIDFSRLNYLSRANALHEIQRYLRLPLRTFQATTDPPFFATGITNAPLPLNDRQADRVVALWDEEPALRRWFLQYATLLQRPLYVGRAGNLFNRFRGHVRPGSRFRDYLALADLEIAQCAFSYLEQPVATRPGGQHYSCDEEDFEEATGVDVLETLLHRLAKPTLGRKIE